MRIIYLLLTFQLLAIAAKLAGLLPISYAWVFIPGYVLAAIFLLAMAMVILINVPEISEDEQVLLHKLRKYRKEQMKSFSNN